MHHQLVLVRLTPAGRDLLGQADTIALGIEARYRSLIGDDLFVALVSTADALAATQQE